MGSVAVHEVVPHFPSSMFGAGGGRHAQDSPGAPQQRRRSSLSDENHKYSSPSYPVSQVHDTVAADRGQRASRDSDKLKDPDSARIHSSADFPMSDANASHAASSSGMEHMNVSGERPSGHLNEPSSQRSNARTSVIMTDVTDDPRSAYGDYTAPTASHGTQPSAEKTSPMLPPSSPSALARAPPAPASPSKIKVRSLAHIQSFATDEHSPFSQTRSSSRRARRDNGDIGPQYEISDMPVGDIIEMVAGLLTKITSTNDRQHEHLHRQIPPNPDGGPPTTANMSQQTSSVLAFHGKNVPSISILSYLGRINKYCPTTYEVFLSLLVYFDRMTERVNSGPMKSLRRASQQNLQQTRTNNEAGHSSGYSSTTNSSSSAQFSCGSQSQLHQGTPTPPPSGSLGKAPDSFANVQREQLSPMRSSHPAPEPILDTDQYNISQFFVVDSFNIHRLVIAGVTCASKFFSDIFYTNSRYAKVGGLPLVELNHLELQFLILNDFRLSVPLEEMEAYGTMLVEFYAREVVAQQQLALS